MFKRFFSCDFLLSNEEKEFRLEFSNWLAESLQSLSPEERDAWHSNDLELRWRSWRSWQRKLYEGQWIGVTWPKKYGGREVSPFCEFIVGELLAENSAPYSANWISIAAVAHAILNFGTEEQKLRHLPKIASCEEIWCLGVTEPDTGSNVMGTKTFAKQNEKGFVIDGTKKWITNSPRATHSLILTRTSVGVRPEWSLTMFMLDLKSPGVKITPLKQLQGEDNYGEIELNSVQTSGNDILGELNRGWLIQTSTWLRESLPPWDISHRLGLFQILNQVKDLGDEGLPVHLGSQLGEAVTDAEMVRLLTARALQNERPGAYVNSFTPMIKLTFSETTQKLYDFGLEISDENDSLEWKVDSRTPLYRHVSARSNTIARAPSAIHRNFLAKYVLGLDR